MYYIRICVIYTIHNSYFSSLNMWLNESLHLSNIYSMKHLENKLIVELQGISNISHSKMPNQWDKLVTRATAISKPKAQTLNINRP